MTDYIVLGLHGGTLNPKPGFGHLASPEQVLCTEEVALFLLESLKAPDVERLVWGLPGPPQVRIIAGPT